MTRRFDAMVDTFKTLEQIMNELLMIKDAQTIVVETQIDSLEYRESVNNAYKALCDAHSVLMRQKYGFLNTEY